MNDSGMTLIVKNVTKLVIAFIVVFAIYVALTGHISPGGGFAGGVILAAAGVLVVLAFGRHVAAGLVTERKCHFWDAAGAMGFLVVALLGFAAGSFFSNFLARDPDAAGNLVSGGAIPLSNAAILLKVGAGLAGAFLALAAYGRLAKGADEETDA